MNDSRNLISIDFFELLTLSIRWYSPSCARWFDWGTRDLGRGRKSFDAGRLSLIVERWWVR